MVPALLVHALLELVDLAVVQLDELRLVLGVVGRQQALQHAVQVLVVPHVHVRLGTEQVDVLRYQDLGV